MRVGIIKLHECIHKYLFFQFSYLLFCPPLPAIDTPGLNISLTNIRDVRDARIFSILHCAQFEGVIWHNSATKQIVQSRDASR